jgi:hypothetical protein
MRAGGQVCDDSPAFVNLLLSGTGLVILRLVLDPGRLFDIENLIGAGILTL